MQCGIRGANAEDGPAALSLRSHSHTRGDLEATNASRFVRRRWGERADVVKTGGECCRVAGGYRSRKADSYRGMPESWDRHSLDWRSNHHQSFRGPRDRRCAAGRGYSRHDQETYEPRPGVMDRGHRTNQQSRNHKDHGGTPGLFHISGTPVSQSAYLEDPYRATETAAPSAANMRSQPHLR